MGEKGAPKTAREVLLAELEGIRDIYRLDVKQFIGFVRERKLFFVEGFRDSTRNGWMRSTKESATRRRRSTGKLRRHGVGSGTPSKKACTRAACGGSTIWRTY